MLPAALGGLPWCALSPFHSLPTPPLPALLQSEPASLAHLTLAIPKGLLTVLVGPVGAGKTSLLSALMGELELVGGRLVVCPQLARPGARVAYVGQNPWVLSGSILDNILLGRTMEPQLLHEVGGAWLAVVLLAHMQDGCCWEPGALIAGMLAYRPCHGSVPATCPSQ